MGNAKPKAGDIESESGTIIGQSIDPSTIAGNSDDGFDPDIHSGRDKRNSDGSFARKRGRKSGSGNSGSSASKKTGDLKGSIDALSRTFFMLHLGIANVAKAPEFVIDQSESDLLANATVNVLNEFDLKPDPKIEAIFGLIVAAGTVYGPRFYLVRKRKQDEASKSDNVYVDQITTI